MAERGLTVDDDLSYVREFEHITLSRVLLARHATEGDTRALQDALSLLGRLLAAAEAGHRNGSAIEILILQAVAHHADGDTAAALAAVTDALGRAEPEGYVRLFLHAGPAVPALIASVAQDQGATHARRVMAAGEPTAAGKPTTAPSPMPGSSSGPSPLVDDLSPRELDVLRLLRSDLSGPEIAGELLVSLNTFRTHTKSIYTKLGVNNRREAISRAAELGL